MIRILAVCLVAVLWSEGSRGSQGSSANANARTENISIAQADVRRPGQNQSSFSDQQRGRSLAAPDVQETNWLVAIAVLLCLALIVSILISFYLYRWRRILLSSPHLLVPEELGERINAHEKALRKIEAAFVNGTGRLAERSDHMSGQVSSLVETFMALQNAIDEKDQEIRRFKSGYDIQVFRRYLFRFVRVHQSIIDFERAGEIGEREVSMIKRLLEDALDECGVEPFEPNIGEDYREVVGVADNPKSIPTDDLDENFKIAEVVEPGYRIRTEGKNFDAIVPSKVKIFVHGLEG